MMNATEMSYALESMLLAARAPCKKRELSASLRRFLQVPEAQSGGDRATVSEPDEGPASAAEPLVLTAESPAQPSFGAQFQEAFALLESRWLHRATGGVVLTEVAEGWAFRTNIRFGPLLSQQQGRPVKLSKPAFEALAIVAYRQPITKPDIDALRGVDSGNGLKVLLDRGLISVVGKKEEPGRPLLYATTPHFLNVFSLPKLSDLPSLAQVEELAGPGADAPADLESLAASAPELMPEDEAASAALTDAIAELDDVQAAARAAFAEHGIEVDQTGSAGADASAAGGEPTMH